MDTTAASISRALPSERISEGCASSSLYVADQDGLAFASSQNRNKLAKASISLITTIPLL